MKQGSEHQRWWSKGFTRILVTTLSVAMLAACGGPESAEEEELGTAQSASTVLRSGVIMQGFYWDVPVGFYSTLAAKAPELANMAGGYGIDSIWFPPASKADNGCNSMGYDPYDYFDVGQYNQKGCQRTRFGTQAQLKAAIAAYRSRNIDVMADIVLNHRSGGQSEWNPVANSNTWTNFGGVLSGKNKWHYESFHPASCEWNDEGAFGGFPDVNYNCGYAYNDTKTWMNWLKSSTNAGFTQWRFDYVKGIHPWVVKDMKAATGNPFTVGEYWDSNTSTLDWWVNQANSSAFDFALYYTLKDICNNTGGGGYLPNVLDYGKSFAAKNPTRAVTFVGNHDTDEIYTDKMLAYAFILTYQGYPMIWWKDYYNYGLATAGGAWGNGIKQLVWARGKLGRGAPQIEILKSNDGNQLIYGSRGYSSTAPGYIVIINDSTGGWLGSRVQTGNAYLKGKTLKAYAWGSTKSGQNYAPANQTVDANGWVSVYAAPRGYAVYSVNGF